MVSLLAECYIVRILLSSEKLFQIDFFHLAICVCCSSVSFCGSIAHFFLGADNAVVWMDSRLFTHSATQWIRLGCFRVLAIRNKTAGNI